MKETIARPPLNIFYRSGCTEAGIDEAGRGCYAGPVVAAAVILPADFYHPLLNDSKQLKENERYMLRPLIEEKAIAWACSFVPCEEIDRINILQATYKAMHGAIAALKVKPELLLIDGNRFKPYNGIEHQCFVGGDGRFASIAAASILAKTYRDDYMVKLHQEFPDYGWDKNKGYGTAVHRKAIEMRGLCMHHRKSFAIGPWQLKIDFKDCID
jgi:ribonuclease HII